MKRRLLLLSNSTLFGQSYFEWSKSIVNDFLGSSVETILFIPFAGVTISWDEYKNLVSKALDRYKIQGIHEVEDMVQAVNSAQVICIGGGNTFNLLYKLQENNLISIIRKRILEDGIPYIGWSAGSNVACVDIGTTNDMPVIWPSTDSALNLFPYNLNPHYTEATIPNINGESRITRLNEAFEVKQRSIVALPEGTGIKVENGKFQFFRTELPQYLPLTVKVWKKVKNSKKPEILEYPMEEKQSDWKQLDIFS